MVEISRSRCSVAGCARLGSPHFGSHAHELTNGHAGRVHWAIMEMRNGVKADWEIQQTLDPPEFVGYREDGDEVLYVPRLLDESLPTFVLPPTWYDTSSFDGNFKVAPDLGPDVEAIQG